MPYNLIVATTDVQKEAEPTRLSAVPVFDSDATSCGFTGSAQASFILEIRIVMPVSVQN